MTSPGEPAVVPTLRRGRYRHFKGGEYRVLDLARDSETEAWLVIYRPLYGERGLWVRSLAAFEETVEHGGERCQRFEYLGE